MEVIEQISRFEVEDTEDHKVWRKALTYAAWHRQTLLLYCTIFD